MQILHESYDDPDSFRVAMNSISNRTYFANQIPLRELR